LSRTIKLHKKRLNMPRGRPKWNPPAPEEIEKLAALGLTEGEIAHCLGICQDTLIVTKKEYSYISEAIKRGQAQGHRQVANALFTKATSGDVGAAAFYLKCRAGWKETNKLEHSGPEGKPIEQEVKVTPVDIALKEILDRVVR
jgi:hypothetical protein